MRFNRRGWRAAILALLICAAAGTPAWAQETTAIDLIIRLASQRVDADALQRLQAWRELLVESRGLPVAQQLERVNRFFNAFPYMEDQQHWGRSDYWATPIEFITSGAGDCEDFAIAKYFSLRQLGVAPEHLRITYVRALKLQRAHMVLAYYQDLDDEPVVLDNLDAEIRPASQRSDLRPIYGFNGDNIWLVSQMRGRGELVGGNRIGRWQHLITRLETAAGPTFYH